MSNATAAPITESETLHLVTAKRGGGNTECTLAALRVMFEAKGQTFQWGHSRLYTGVALVRVNGHVVAQAFRCKLDAVAYFQELNR